MRLTSLIVCVLALTAVGLPLLSRAEAQTIDSSGRITQVTYSSDTITISADLSIPDGIGPCPVVIFVHGSGTSPRSNPVARAYQGAFAERGVAFLNPDKRGSGESGGDWAVASFDDLAGDVVAAIRFLKTRPEIDSNRIAILGFSQGSDIVSIVGSNSSVARVISLSGSVVPLQDQIRDEVRIMATEEGLSPDEIAHVDSLNSLAFAYAFKLDQPERTTAWSEYDQVRKQLSGTAIGATETVSGFPVDSSDDKFQFLASVGSFNPIEHWLQVTAPTLFIYGAKDQNVDCQKSIDLIQEYLIPQNEKMTVLLFGQHSHAFIRNDQLDFIVRWITEN